MDKTVLYFAYGSNMHLLRLQERVPSCEVLASAELPGHSLRFHKRSDNPTDHSGKCNIVAEQRVEGAVIGVVYRFLRGEKPLLDAAEGPGYESIMLEVETAGSRLEVYTYRARSGFIDDGLKPYTWYRELVVRGARLHRLPEEYIYRLASTDALEDHDADRASLHFLLANSL